jgi:hypothetical protein
MGPPTQILSTNVMLFLLLALLPTQPGGQRLNVI